MSGTQVTTNQILKLGHAIYKKATAVPYNDQDRGYLGGSEISGCIRKTVAKHLHMPQTHPRSKVASRRLQLGHIIEAWVVEDFQYGIADSKHVRLTHTGNDQFDIIPQTTPIQLHPDGLFSIKDGPSWTDVAWLEIKSASEKSLKRQKEDGLYPEYIGQAIGEMHYGKPKMVLFHVSQLDKMDSYIQRVVPYEKGAGEWFDARAKHVHALIEAQELPEGEPTALCSFCPFQGACSASGHQAWRNAPRGTNQELIQPTKEAAEKVRKYMALNARKKDIDTQMKTLREYVEVHLSKSESMGYDMNRERISCKFTKPSIKRKLDMAKILAKVPAEILLECYKEDVIPPTLRIGAKRGKTNTAQSHESAEPIQLEKKKSAPLEIIQDGVTTAEKKDGQQDGQQGELLSLFMAA